MDDRPTVALIMVDFASKMHSVHYYEGSGLCDDPVMAAQESREDILARIDPLRSVTILPNETAMRNHAERLRQGTCCMRHENCILRRDDLDALFDAPEGPTLPSLVALLKEASVQFGTDFESKRWWTEKLKERGLLDEEEEGQEGEET